MATRQTTGGGWGVAGLHRLHPLNAHGGSTSVPNILGQGRAPGAPWAAVPLLHVGWPRRPSVATRQTTGGGWGGAATHRLHPLQPGRGGTTIPLVLGDPLARHGVILEAPGGRRANRRLARTGRAAHVGAQGAYPHDDDGRPQTDGGADNTEKHDHLSAFSSSRRRAISASKLTRL